MSNEPISKEMALEHSRELLLLQEAAAHGGYFADSKPAEFQYGINYVGPWETEWAGVQASVRRHARALSKTGMPVWLLSRNHRMEYRDEHGEILSGFADHTLLEDSVRQEVGHILDRRHAQSLLSIEHMIFSIDGIARLVYPARLSRLGPNSRKRSNATTVLYTVFERSQLDSELRQAASMMQHLAQVWVPCERNRSLLIEAGMPEEKVVRMPHPLSPKDPVWQHRSLSRSPRHSGPIRFVHVGKWEPRKAQHELIGAFLQTFEPGQAQLALKCSTFGAWEGYPHSPQQSVGMWLLTDRVKRRGWNPSNVHMGVRWLKKPMSRDAMVRLIAGADVYVSSGRVEGFDMPALDAKLLGVRLLVMGHGGAEDFCTASDVRWGGDRTEPAHPGYNWKDARCAGFDVQDIRLALGEIASSDIEHEPLDPIPYTESVVGHKMLSECLKIVSQFSPEFEFAPVGEYLHA